MKNKFTRIELLIVVAVLGVLGAILVPTFADAVSDAAKTKCANGLKEMGVAVGIFAEDNDNVIPGVYVVKNGQVVDSWLNLLAPYTDYETYEIKRLCPSNGLDYNPDNKTDDGAWCARYAIVNLAGDSTAMVARGKIANPAVKVYMADGQVNDRGFVDKWDLSNIPSLIIQPSAPHEDGTNMLFVDGHVGYGKRISSGSDMNWPDVKGEAFIEGNHCRVVQK